MIFKYILPKFYYLIFYFFILTNLTEVIDMILKTEKLDDEGVAIDFEIVP